MLQILKGVVSDGGEKPSFGRISAFIVIVMGLCIVVTGIASELSHPTGVQVYTYELLERTNNVGDAQLVKKEIVSKPVANINWLGLGGFLTGGIMPLAGLLYAGSKLAKTAGNGNGK